MSLEARANVEAWKIPTAEWYQRVLSAESVPSLISAA